MYNSFSTQSLEASLNARRAATGVSTCLKGDRLHSESRISAHSSSASQSASRFHRNSRRGQRPRAKTQTSTADWTVMVYAAGDNLEKFGIQDFLEMSRIGSNNKINIVLQFDRTAGYDSSYGNWTDTRRGLVQAGDKPNSGWGSSIGEVNMGSANTLQNFVNWGTQTYKAKQYALVMWGHGDGFSLAYDDITGDAISGGELNGVLRSSADAGKKISFVGADACLMGTTEFAQQICNNASVLVGSQELEPGTGWNYETLFKDLKTSPTADAAQLGAFAVTSYGRTYPSSDETLSAINLSALRTSDPLSLTQAISSFSSIVMKAATRSDLNALGRLRDYFANDFASSTNDPTNYCDIGKLFNRVASHSGISLSVRSAAQSVLSAYTNAVIQNFSSTVGRSTGLSLYFSKRGSQPKSDYNATNYSFAAETQWDEFLNWLWQ